jgi:hypothetical protein
MFIGRIPTGGGWRVHGRAVAETTKRKQPVGYDYVHSLVDDHPRLACSEVLGEEKGTTCAGFVIRAAASVAAHVLTPPPRTGGKPPTSRPAPT